MCVRLEKKNIQIGFEPRKEQKLIKLTRFEYVIFNNLPIEIKLSRFTTVHIRSYFLNTIYENILVIAVFL